MSKRFLDYLKEYIDDDYTIESALLSGIKTDTPAFSISLVRDGKHIHLQMVPYEQILEVKEYIKTNYPEVPFIKR